MFIQIPPKKLKTIAVSATFEHDGVPYEERFSSLRKFSNYLKRTKDRFCNAVDHESMKVIHPQELGMYI